MRNSRGTNVTRQKMHNRAVLIYDVTAEMQAFLKQKVNRASLASQFRYFLSPPTKNEEWSFVCTLAAQYMKFSNPKLLHKETHDINMIHKFH